MAYPITGNDQLQSEIKAIVSSFGGQYSSTFFETEFNKDDTSAPSFTSRKEVIERFNTQVKNILTGQTHERSRAVLSNLVNRHYLKLDHNNSNPNTLNQLAYYLSSSEDKDHKIACLLKLEEQADSCGNGFFNRVAEVTTSFSVPTNIDELISEIRENAIECLVSQSINSKDLQSVHGIERLRQGIRLAGMRNEHNSEDHFAALNGSFSIPSKAIKKLKADLDPDTYIDAMLDRFKEIFELNLNNSTGFHASGNRIKISQDDYKTEALMQKAKITESADEKNKLIEQDNKKPSTIASVWHIISKLNKWDFIPTIGITEDDLEREQGQILQLGCTKQKLLSFINKQTDINKVPYFNKIMGTEVEAGQVTDAQIKDILEDGTELYVKFKKEQDNEEKQNFSADSGVQIYTGNEEEITSGRYLSEFFNSIITYETSYSDTPKDKETEASAYHSKQIEKTVNWDYVRELLIKEMHNKKYVTDAGDEELRETNNLVSQLNTDKGYIIPSDELNSIAMRTHQLNQDTINAIALRANELNPESIMKIAEQADKLDEDSINSIAQHLSKITSTDAIYALAVQFKVNKIKPSQTFIDILCSEVDPNEKKYSGYLCTAISKQKNKNVEAILHCLKEHPLQLNYQMKANKEPSRLELAWARTRTTPVDCAIKARNWEALKTLLKVEDGLNSDEKAKVFTSEILHLAISNHQLGLAINIIDKCDDKRKIIDERGKNGNTALDLASIHGPLELVEKILKEKGALNAALQPTEGAALSPLACAAKHQQWEIVILIIKDAKAKQVDLTDPKLQKEISIALHKLIENFPKGEAPGVQAQAIEAAIKLISAGAKLRGNKMFVRSVIEIGNIKLFDKFLKIEGALEASLKPIDNVYKSPLEHAVNTKQCVIVSHIIKEAKAKQLDLTDPKHQQEISRALNKLTYMFRKKESNVVQAAAAAEAAKALIDAGADLFYRYTSPLGKKIGDTTMDYVRGTENVELAEEFLKREKSSELLELTKKFPKNGKEETESVEAVEAVEAAKILISAGAKVCLDNKDGMNTLHYAIATDNKNLVEEILKCEGAPDTSFMVNFNNKISPLRRAIIRKKWEIVRLIIEKAKAEPSADLHHHEKEISSALLKLTTDFPKNGKGEQEALEAAKILIGAGATVYLNHIEGMNTLHYAIATDNKNLVEEILKCEGAPEESFKVNYKNKSSPLRYAVLLKNWEMVSHIISKASEQGQNIDLTNHQEEISIALLELTKNFSKNEEEGAEALKAAKILIGAGAKVCLYHTKGMNTLHYAIATDNKNLVEEILKCEGAPEESFKVNYKNNSSPLRYAVLLKNWEMVSHIITKASEQGQNIDFTNHQEEISIALLELTKNFSKNEEEGAEALKAAKILIGAGANVCLTDGVKSALDIAIEIDNEELLKKMYQSTECPEMKISILANAHKKLFRDSDSARYLSLDYMTGTVRNSSSFFASIIRRSPEERLESMTTHIEEQASKENNENRPAKDIKSRRLLAIFTSNTSNEEIIVNDAEKERDHTVNNAV